MFSKADLHIHTWYSYDSFASIKSVVKNALKNDLKIIAITDHDAINGALATKRYVEKHNIDLKVIVGEEISSKGGHVIGLFLKKLIPPHLSLRETIHRIKDQGGLVVIPHPTFCSHLPQERIFRYRVHYKDLLDHPDVLADVDAIESANFTMFDSHLTENVMKHASQFGKTLFGSSDAHVSKHIGSAVTIFPGVSIDDLKKSIFNKSTKSLQLRKHTKIDWVLQHSAIAKIPFSLGYYSVRNVIVGIIDYVQTRSD